MTAVKHVTLSSVIRERRARLCSMGVAVKEKLSFVTPDQATTGIYSMEEYHAPRAISWADQSKDISTWSGNAMQKEALSKIYELKSDIENRPDLQEDWRKLQTSDLFYYMSTKTGQDGEVHGRCRPHLNRSYC